MMPRVTGFGVLEYLREHQPTLSARTVVITAFPRLATNELSGLCEVLAKPFDLDQLLTAVARCANNSDLVR